MRWLINAAPARLSAELGAFAPASKRPPASSCSEVQSAFAGCNFRGMCTRADNLQIAFPTTASPETRAILLGAAFLLDYLYFEQDSRVCCGGSDRK